MGGVSDLIARLRATEDWDDKPWWWASPEKTFGDGSPASLLAEAADRLAELESIVRDLAKLSPTSLQGEPTLHGEWNECELCGERNDTEGQDIDHRPGCPWRRAKEWVDGHE